MVQGRQKQTFNYSVDFYKRIHRPMNARLVQIKYLRWRSGHLTKSIRFHFTSLRTSIEILMRRRESERPDYANFGLSTCCEAFIFFQFGCE